MCGTLEVDDLPHWQEIFVLQDLNLRKLYDFQILPTLSVGVLFDPGVPLS